MDNDVYVVQRQFWLASLGRTNWSWGECIGIWMSWVATGLFVVGLVFLMLNADNIIVIFSERLS